MRPEEHLAKRLSKIFCLRLVSWEQRIMIKTQSGSLKSYTHLLSGGVFSGRFVKSKMPFKAVSRTSLSKQTLTKFGR